MSTHWRLAFWYAAWVAAGAALIGVVIWSLYGGAYTGAFLYGAGVGIVSFVSMAGTVSLLTGGSGAFRKLIGAASFIARYGFVAAALGVPAYLGLWPVVVMLVGCAGVYAAENVVLLPRVLLAKSDTVHSVREKVERRVEV